MTQQDAPVTTYEVDGMTCSGCVRGLETALERADPNLAVEVSIGQLVVRGSHDPDRLSKAVEDAGFELRR